MSDPVELIKFEESVRRYVLEKVIARPGRGWPGFSDDPAGILRLAGQIADFLINGVVPPPAPVDSGETA